jgi:hypothetical protein
METFVKNKYLPSSSGGMENKIKCSVCFQPYVFKSRSIHYKSKKHQKVMSIMDEYTKIIVQVLENERRNPELISIVK